MNTRRNLLIGGGAIAAIGAAGWQFGLRPMLNPDPPEIGFTLSEAELANARDFMDQHPIIDSHAHPGRTFMRGAENLTFKLKLYKWLGGTFEDRTIADMQAGGVDGAVFSGVADVQLLSLGDNGLTAARAFEPGEAWASYRRQITNLRHLGQAGKVQICLTSDDVLDAKATGQRAAILAMEGADFLENDLTRLQQIHADGVRMLTLVHYHDNSLGDIMTGPVGSRGLTAFGRETVAAIEAMDITIDLSHASPKTAQDVLSIATRPVVLTHTHIATPKLSHPRFVSLEIAQGVAASGGYIGAWPAGIGQSSLAEFIDRIEFLIDAVGINHVAMGSDMDANYKPVLETYRKMPLVVGALMKRGVTGDALAKIMGGNVLKLLGKS